MKYLSWPSHDREIPNLILETQNRSRWGPLSYLTYHRAHQKPLLLLFLMDLIAQGQITDNFIELSFDFVVFFIGSSGGAVWKNHV